MIFGDRQVQEEKGKKLKDFEAALPGNKDIEAPAPPAVGELQWNSGVDPTIGTVSHIRSSIEGTSMRIGISKDRNEENLFIPAVGCVASPSDGIVETAVFFFLFVVFVFPGSFE